MKKDKITMKDIAKELNLSLATISYVLNHSDKEKISHQTRIRVLETAKRLGYVPNQTAKSLANKKSNLIGIIVNLSNFASSNLNYQYLDLASELQSQINKAGYDTILSVNRELEDIQIKYKHSLEAAFIIDIDETTIKRVSNQYYVPIIFLDCDFEEGLFYKILPDYGVMIEKAKKLLEAEHPYLIMDAIMNQPMRERITAYFSKEDIFTCNGTASLKDFLSQKKNRKGIVIGDLLGVQVERYVDNSQIVVFSSTHNQDLLLSDTKRIVVSNQQKSLIAMDIFHKIITLEYNNDGVTRVLLQPEE